MKKVLLITFLFLAYFTGSLHAQVYSNVLVEVNLCAEMTPLNISAPFVWCRQNNTLYYYDANLATFTAYPTSTVVSINTLSGVVTLTTANINDATNKRYVSDAQLVVLGNTSGTNTGDQNISGLMVKANNLSDLTSVSTAKTNLSLVKGDVGLSNVDNTSDATKNAAAVTLTNKTLTSPAITTPMGIVKGDVGLGNVDNTSDANKPVSTAQQTALNLKVNLTQPYGYTVDFQGLTSSPVDGQTIFIGNVPRAPTTTAATSQIFIRKAGTIKVAEVYCFSGTAGTNEAWSANVRLNNTTDTLIQTVSTSATVRTFTNSALSIAVAAGDYVEIKFVNPTWATNPLTTVFAGYLYIE